MLIEITENSLYATHSSYLRRKGAIFKKKNEEKMSD